jgi:hypothetical protein
MVPKKPQASLRVGRIMVVIVVSGGNLLRPHMLASKDNPSE